MICRDQLSNANDDGHYSLDGGRNEPNPQWCNCQQGECRLIGKPPWQPWVDAEAADRELRDA